MNTTMNPYMNLTMNTTMNNNNQINSNIGFNISDIGFIAIGQAGGNITHLFEQLNYQCLFINTSKNDIIPLQTKHNYITPNTDGCNHNRTKAKKILQKHYREILSLVSDIFTTQNLIYTVASTGGGTGAGFIPLLTSLLIDTFPDKKFGSIVILPSDNESPQIQFNAYETYKELSSIENIASVFTLDNNNTDKYKLNTQFVNLFHSTLNIPSHVSYQSNIDTAELFNMLTQRGNTLITQTPKSSNPNNTISQVINSITQQQIFSPISQDKNIIYLALSLTEYPTESQIQDILRHIGKPLDIFINVNNDSNIALLTGLTFPIKRIEQIVNNMKKDKDKIQSNKTNANTNKIDIDFELFDTKQELLNIPNSNITSNSITRNLDSIFNKFLVS